MSSITFDGFKGDTGNSLRVISTIPGAAAGDDTVVVLGEFLPDGTEVSNTTVTVQGGVRGVSLHSGTPTPVNALETDGTIGEAVNTVPNSLVGDLFLETDEDRLYERVADSTEQDVSDAAAEVPTRVIVEGETWSFLSDFTGEKGDAATIAVGTVATVAADADATVSNSGTTSDAVLNFNIPQGADGTDADIINFVFQDAATAPASPADSAGVPVGWVDTAPATVTNTLYTVQGTQTEGIGDFNWGTVIKLSGDDGDISASSIDALSDVDTTTIDPVDGDILTFDGSNWVSQTPTTAPSAIPLFQTGNVPANSVFAFTSPGGSPAVSGGLKIYGNGDLPPGNRIVGGITNFNTGNDATAAITISRIDSDGDLIDLIAPITFTIAGSTQTLTITNLGTEISDADYTTSTLSKTDFFLTTNGAYTVTGDILGPTSFTTTVPIGGEQILPLAVTYEAGVAVRHNDGTTDNWYRTYAGVDTAVDATSFPDIDTANWEVY